MKAPIQFWVGAFIVSAAMIGIAIIEKICTFVA